MSDARHDRVADLFGRVIDLGKGERREVLDHECAQDPQLRVEVESLLAAHDGAGGRLLTPAAAESGAAGDEPAEAQDRHEMPERIGQYRLMSVLGEGGMGVVYLAEGDRPRRRIALKVIRPGAASRAMLKRFEREAQALARLQHPGVAAVYETGSADTGRGPQPYIAMELVEGTPLHQHVRERGLGLRQRVELIARVCEAVHHAHERGVVHRDLKPANVLVMDEPTTLGSGSADRSGTDHATGHVVGVGRPKVLDFGIARLADDGPAATIATRMGQLIGTLAYMSPEQVSGGVSAVDARSDVYALGVMLYEVLAGRLPLDVRAMSAPEAVRAIKEDDAPMLSTIDRQLRGDVETIVAKALEKDPGRRYQTAADLGADLRRYLSDQPIEARPAGTLYQARKFARRNRGLVGGIATALVVLAGSTVALAILARQAIQQRDAALSANREKQAAMSLAQEEAEAARKVNQFMNGLLSRADPRIGGGKAVTIADVADEIDEQIGELFAKEPKVAAALHLTIGKLFQGQGRYELSERHSRQAAEMYDGLGGPDHPETLRSRSQLAVCLESLSRSRESGEVLEDALARAERTLGTHDDLTCEMLGTLSIVKGSLGDKAASLKLAREWVARLADNPARATQRREAELRLISALINAGKPAEATTLAERVVPEVQAVSDRPTGALVEAMLVLGRSYAAARDYETGEKWMRSAMENAAVVYGEGHPRWLGAADGVAGTLASRGEFEAAEPIARKVLAQRKAKLGPAHKDTLASVNNLGWLLSRAGRYADAEPILREAVADLEKTDGPEHPSTLNALNNLAGNLYNQERFAEVETVTRRLVEVGDRVLPPDHAERGRYRYGLGRSLLKLGRAGEAEPPLIECIRIADLQKPEKNMRRQGRERLIEAYEALGRVDDAARIKSQLDGLQ